MKKNQVQDLKDVLTEYVCQSCGKRTLIRKRDLIKIGHDCWGLSAEQEHTHIEEK